MTNVVRNELQVLHTAEVQRQERISVDLLQRAALPKSMPDSVELSFGAHYRPAMRLQPVGGDWYDAFAVGDEAMALAIADVAGHGPDAASFMLQVRNILRAVAVEHRHPSEVLRRVNDIALSLEPDGARGPQSHLGLRGIGTRPTPWLCPRGDVSTRQREAR